MADRINVEEVARRLAPKIYFHPSEEFFPCSVEWFLNRTSLVIGGATVDYKDNNINYQLPMTVLPFMPGPLTVDKLFSASNSHKFGGGEIDGISLSPMASAPGTAPSYSRKGYYTNYQLDTLYGEPRANGIQAPCYVRITWCETQPINLPNIGVIEFPVFPGYYLISYYFFCAYNGAMGGLSDTAKVMAPLPGGGGYYAHIGDWMRMSARVRIVGDMVALDGVEYETHGDSEIYPAAKGGLTFAARPLGEVPHLEGYSALHSHEMYPSAGDWDLKSTDLAKDKAKKGPAWETWKKLVILDEEPRDPAQKWIFYNGLWGANINIEQTITPEVSIDFGPFGTAHIADATKLSMQKNGPSGPAFKRDWNRGKQYRPPLLGPRAFDAATYTGYYPDLKAAFGSDAAAARAHWVTRGLPVEGRRGSPGLDTSLYLKLYADLQEAFGGDGYERALDHWSLIGLPVEGRRGSAEFDVGFYLRTYGDLQSAFGNNFGAAFDHWVQYGRREGRRTSREFDLGFYFNHYPDLKAAFATNPPAALDHWFSYGIKEGRRTAREFDVSFYLNYHADLKAAFGNDFAAAIRHWLTYGFGEGRRTAVEFDIGFYLGNYPDLKAAFGTDNAQAFDHWLSNGLREGRQSSREFDVKFYVGNYPDLQAAFGTDYAAAFDHWLSNGLKEGRRGSREFDVSFYLNTYPDLKAAFGTNYGAALNHWLTRGSPEEHRKGAPD